MLTLANHPVKTVDIKVRTEYHGPDEVTVLHLRVTAQVSNLELAQLSSTLCSALFVPPDEEDLVLDALFRPRVRNPELGILRWDNGKEPASFRVHVNGKPSDDIAFPGATLKTTSILPQEGGTCRVTYPISVQPTEAEAARLLMLLKHETHATLQEAEELSELEIVSAG